MFTRVVARQLPALSRRFQTSAVRKADLVQDLYLRELKSYKPQPVSAKDAESHVRHWKVPAAPKAPEVEGDISEVSAYESAPVEVEHKATGSSSAQESTEDWFVVEDIPEEEHH